MACEEVQSWSFGGLTGAFLDLLLAYLLLCISAVVFFISKLLKFLWVYFPCPCNGVFGYRNRDLCLHKLLIEWPVGKVCAVQKLVMSRFPFDVQFKDQTCNLSQKLVRDVNGRNGVYELGCGSCCSPFASPRLQSLVDKESGYDAKGKRIVILKKRTGIRRPRRDSSKSPRIFPLPLDERDTNEVSGESSIALAAVQDELQATRDDIGDNIRGSKLSGSAVESTGLEISYSQEKFSIVENESDTIRMLQGALQKEKAATAALYLELEKERAAAATAADEAMAMIYRLQKDKASTEMEVRQYQRMIEEKFVYDEEEMDVLKEILLTREKENHFLEKEVEAYRQMNSLGSEQSNGDSNDKLCEWGQTGLPSSIDSPLMMPWTNETKSSHMGVGNTAESTCQNEATFVEKQIHSDGGHDVVDKSVLSTSEDKLQTDNAVCPGMTTVALHANIGFKKQLYCDGEERQQDGNIKSNFQSPMFDTEPAVYDVHVIEGKAEMSNGESRLSIDAALEGLHGSAGVCSSSEPLMRVGKGKTPI